MINTFYQDNFLELCDGLSKKDPHLLTIIEQHGYPPLWKRKPDFATLVHIILEQQVSLASARAALTKLKQKLGRITAKKVIELTDAELRACYFSRQKTIYVKALANAILSGELDLKTLNGEPDEIIREKLKKIKGIGDWTVDIYLLMALSRLDIFPTGDLALVNSMRKIKKLKPGVSREEILKIAEDWSPHRSLATMLFWHVYLRERNIKL
jgi:DNA-3-methyladenine glycosylase II